MLKKSPAPRSEESIDDSLAAGLRSPLDGITESISDRMVTSASYDELPDDGNQMGEPLPQMAYTFERLITAGGFGEIWEATQCSLGRIVAIKRIRRDLLERAAGDQKTLRRYELSFRQEAMIAGSLEHPNIVPIHDMGLDEDGYPLLAMKLVRGKPWDRLIAEDFQLPISLFLQKHLPILAAVCQAVAFAHSRGVIHRDLKPSQIMVGEFGEFQLMDWGIAVRMEDIKTAIERPEVSFPFATNPSGTAAFMAPEQTERTLVNLGPWTDVFLLGGTLYYLLTGRVPHGADTANGSFYLASRGEVVPPQVRNPHRECPAPLAELAMHAMVRSRKDRVLSAEEFHRRLQDYITGEGRRRESMAMTRRVADWLSEDPRSYNELGRCSNHLDQALSLWPENPVIRSQREQVQRLFAEAALAHSDLVLARMHAERLAGADERSSLLSRILAAEEAQAQAAERFRRANDNAQQLLEFILLDLHDSLRNLGRLDLLEKAAHKVFSHFEQFPETTVEEQGLRNRCKALRNIAEVFKEKARLSESVQALREAIRIADNHLKATPQNVTWLEDISDSWDKMGATHYELGDLEAAVRYNERGLALRQFLVQQDSTRLDWRSRLAWSYHQQGVVLWRMGRQQDALADLEEAIRIRQLIIDEEPDNLTEISARAYSHNSRTWVRRALGDVEGAMTDVLESLRLREWLATGHPENLIYQADVAWSLKSYGLLLEDRFDLAEALATFRKALVTCQRLSDSDPSNANRKMELAFCHGGIARTQHTMGNLAEAEAAYRAAIEIHAPLTESENANGRDLRDHLYNVSGLSAVLLEQGDKEGALDVALRGLTWSQVLVRRTRQNPAFVEARARALVQVGRARAELGDRHAAEEHWREAVDTMLPFFKEGDYPAVQEETLAVALVLLGRRREAEPYIQRLMAKNWGGREFLKLLEGTDAR